MEVQLFGGETIPSGDDSRDTGADDVEELGCHVAEVRPTQREVRCLRSANPGWS
jgi:hypothetical protein